MSIMNRSEPRALATTNRRRQTRLARLLTALYLGLTSFGGPVAHLGYPGVDHGGAIADRCRDAVAGLILLQRWKAPPLAVVAVCVLGSVLSRI